MDRTRNEEVHRGAGIERESKGKVFYGQEKPRGESTTTVSNVNYQLLQ